MIGWRWLSVPVRLTVMGLVLLPAVTRADGVVINRIYDPYVQPLETELEWRGIFQSDDTNPDQQKHYLGLGRSLSDRWAVELYTIGIKNGSGSLSVDAFEFEIKRQLTEQGEFSFDWGLLFELEREVNGNGWEVATNLLISREFGRWTATSNIAAVYEWGSRIKDEFETELHLQARYRLAEAFEPTFELHAGQNTMAIGPAMTGLRRLSAGKKLFWELGVYFGLDDQSRDQTIKASLEFEF